MARMAAHWRKVDALQGPWKGVAGLALLKMPSNVAETSRPSRHVLISEHFLVRNADTTA